MLLRLRMRRSSRRGNCGIIYSAGKKQDDGADMRFAMRYTGPVRQKTVNHVRRGTEQH